MEHAIAEVVVACVAAVGAGFGAGALEMVIGKKFALMWGLVMIVCLAILFVV